MAIRGRKIKMTMTITQINYSDIDQDILRDCFDKSLPYLDASPIPNIIWEEFDIPSSSIDDEKFESLRAKFEDTSIDRILFQIDIDGRIVNYNYAQRETGGTGMVCHTMDLMRDDASGSQGWSYTAEYHQKLDAFFKSIAPAETSFSTWTFAGSGMEAAWDKSVSENWITYTVDEDINYLYEGQEYKKLIITVIV